LRIGVAIRQIPKLDGHAWDSLKKLSVNAAANMLWLRATSLLKMTADIFPRRIRGLVFSSVFEDKTYNGRRVSNLIYSLTKNQTWDIPGIEKPTPKLEAHLTRAVEMPTTLWFDNDEQLPSLVISGQATLCYNLLKHLYRESGKDINTLPPDKRALWDRLAADWNTLRDNPRALLDKQLEPCPPDAR
jgi:hypothetical protein